MRTLFGCFAVLALLLLLVGCPSDPPVQTTLKRQLAAYDGAHADTVRRIYAARDAAPLWIRPDAPTAAMRALLERLCAAEREGLRPSAYPLDSIATALQQAYADPPDDDSLRAARLATLDRLLTTAFAAYTDDLVNGRVPPEKVGNWYVDPPTPDVATVLRHALAEGVRPTLDSLADRNRSYVVLRQALNRYRALAAEGGWSPVPDGPVRAPRALDARPARRRPRLAGRGDLPADAPGDSATFNEAVGDAVQRFQQRHGLEADGVVGPNTLEALNVPAEARAEQIALNLERHRWLPKRLGNTFLFVNLTDFRLSAYEDGALAFDMPVIIGEQGWRTPAFADTMSHVVFGPYWNVPASIAIEELLPQIREDSTFLARNNYEVVNANGVPVDTSRLSKAALADYEVRIRQKPGPGNALGQIKFMFPNNYNIYLHDTPQEHLFARDERALSHGCIRVAGPVRLADYVLSDEGWPRDSIRAAMREVENRRVPVDRPIPVFIAYLTAWAAEDGTVHFREDLYDYDPALRQELGTLEPETNACPAIRAFFDAADVPPTDSS